VTARGSLAGTAPAQRSLQNQPHVTKDYKLLQNKGVTVLISHYQAHALLEARRHGLSRVVTSLDLNLTSAEVELTVDGVVLPDGGVLPWALVEEVAESDSACFSFAGGVCEKVQAYSEETGRVYTLYPTQRAPTMLISGVTMHRIKDIDPLEDTRRKVASVSPVRGRVLDTATGLGYTAIEAAKSANAVVTIEIDATALAIAHLNPWSRDLFQNPKILRRSGDAFTVVRSFDDASFDVIIHDPPAFSLAGSLYSLEFYNELRRLLKPGGRLYHYTGDPDSKSGSGVTRGAARRLEEAGFRDVKRRPQAFGLTARG
jgi:predicted methyltransferase